MRKDLYEMQEKLTNLSKRPAQKKNNLMNDQSEGKFATIRDAENDQNVYDQQDQGEFSEPIPSAAQKLKNVSNLEVSDY